MIQRLKKDARSDNTHLPLSLTCHSTYSFFLNPDTIGQLLSQLSL